LSEAGIDTLYDDRDARAGEKFNDADLLGIPVRIVMSNKTIQNDSVEVKNRTSENVEIIKISEVINYLVN
jgi:prolyl-tRNA synthetase